MHILHVTKTHPLQPYSYSHSPKPDLPVTHSSPLCTWLSILSFACCIELTCYRLAHDDGKCTNCLLQLLLGIHMLIISVGIACLLVSAESFGNCSYILVMNSGPHACRLIKTCSFYNCQTCKQIMCSIRFCHFSIFL